MQVIEQQMSGLDHLIYLVVDERRLRQRASLTLTFAAGTNPDIAQVQVQNKLQLAIAAAARDRSSSSGIRVTKSSSSFLLVAGFVSTDDSMSKLRHRQLRRLARPGPGEPAQRRRQLQRVRHAVRDADLARPGQAQQLPLTPVDVTDAMQSQNVQVSGGQLGGTPAPDDPAAERDDHRSDAAAHARRSSATSC